MARLVFFNGRSAVRVCPDQHRPEAYAVGAGNVLWKRIAHEQRLVRGTAGPSQRFSKNGRVGFVGPGLFTRQDRVEILFNPRQFKHVGELVVINIAHHADMDAASPQRGQRFVHPLAQGKVPLVSLPLHDPVARKVFQ